METMNQDTLKGSFTELKGKAMQQWSKLTDNDFTDLKGNIEELKGKVQKVYGYTKEQVEKEFENFKNVGAETAAKGVRTANDKIDEMVTRKTS